MKLIIILTVAACLQASASALSQQVTLHVQDAPLEKVFREIQKQTGYHFLYSTEVLKQAGRVDLNASNRPLTDVLAECLAHKPLTYSIVDKTVVIREKQQAPTPATFFTPPPAAHDIHVHITDSAGAPLQGASVVVKGTKQGGQTDADGNVTLAGLNGGETLVVSYVGYETKEVSVGDNTALMIVLKQSTSPLDEMHAIAYGTATRRLSTGNVSTVKAETIQQQPITNILQALEGRVSGLQITQSSGVAGAPVKVQLRGQNSLTANNNPLYIVDGVPFTSMPLEQLKGINVAPTGNNNFQEFGNPLNSLNPGDIESIEVLKDADATAIYGSRAANGVILINTKKGKAGKTILSADVRHGAGKVTRMPKMMSTAQFIQFRKDAFANSNITPTAANAPELLAWDQNQDFDWQQWYIGNTSRQTDASITLSGGDAQNTFLLSGNFHDESAIVAGKSRYLKGGFHGVIGHSSLNGKFKIQANIFYNSDHNYLSGAQNAGPFYANVLITAPNFPIYDSTGNYNFPLGNYNWIAKSQAFAIKNTDNLNGNISVSYTFAPGFEFKSNFGYNKLEVKERNGNPSYTLTPFETSQGGANAAFGNNELKTYLVEPQFNYHKTISKGQLDLLVGGTVQENNTTGQQQAIIGYPSDLLLGSTNFGTVSSKSSNTITYRYISLFGRATFNWNDKYILNTTLRRDGSNRFGSDKQFGTFGSIGAAWLFGNENWIRDNIEILSYGKLRASWGTTGNDGIGDYQFLSLYSSGADYGTTGTINPSQISNNRFQWEVNKKLEAALELGFWADRLLLNIAWYRNRSGNQLVNYPLASITGFDSYTANLPALIQNTGLEFDFSGRLVSSKNVSWSADLNVSIPKNKLVAFPNIEQTAYASTYVVGQPTSIVQLYHFLGVDPNTGTTLVQDVDNSGTIVGSSSYNSQGGDYLIAGKTAPDWLAGVGNTFSYKNWSLDFFFQYTKQQGYNLRKFANWFGNNGNVWAELSNYWRNPGDENVIPLPLAGYTISQSRFRDSDTGFGDASFLRLKTLQIAYLFPELRSRKLKIGTVKLYAQGQNLLTVTKFKGFDPETATFPYIMLPPLKQFVIGLQCTF